MPIAAPLIQAGLGLVQGVIGGIKAHKAQKQLEKLKSPTYTQSKGILDYYNQALSRYNVNPTESALYKRGMQAVGRNQAAGINALQDRRSALGGISSVLRASNDAALNANVAAEQERNQRFGVLGQAANMKLGEERMAYQQNELAPFERQYNLLAAKAGGANQIANAGISNAFGGLQNISNMDMLKQIYGNSVNKGGTGGSGGSWGNGGIFKTKYGNLYGLGGGMGKTNVGGGIMGKNHYYNASDWKF